MEYRDKTVWILGVIRVEVQGITFTQSTPERGSRETSFRMQGQSSVATEDRNATR